MDIPTKNNRKILVTQALPYANAPLHLGHILEAVQTDIWTRFQNLNGNECHSCCTRSNAEPLRRLDLAAEAALLVVERRHLRGGQAPVEQREVLLCAPIGTPPS